MDIIDALKKYNGGCFRLKNEGMNRWLVWDSDDNHWKVYESRDNESLGVLICSSSLENLAVNCLVYGTSEIFENK